MISEADKRQFQDQGYLVIESLVPESLCAAAISAISDFLDIDANEPASWLKPDIQGHGIVPLHHAQALWDIRQYPPVHEAFSDLYGTRALWVSIDRSSFKAPSAGFEAPYRVAAIHWDGDPRTGAALSIQGLVYLTDTAEEQGGFCCVPGLFRDLAGYLEHADPDEPALKPDIAGFEVERIAAPAGSLILWDRRLPHSSGENRASTPRFLAYVAMQPEGDEVAREALSGLYLEKRVPQWAVRQSVPGQVIPEPGEPARLSALGRHLVGLERW